MLGVYETIFRLTVSIPASMKSQAVPIISLKSSSGEDKQLSKRDIDAAA